VSAEDDAAAAAEHEALRTVQQFAHWLDLCECGDGAGVVLAPLKAALSRFGDDGFLQPGGDRSQDFWLYLIDGWKLTEHGGSVYGSWLTRAGIRLRAALALVDVDGYADATGESGSWWEREWRQNPGAVLSYGAWEPVVAAPVSVLGGGVQ
jgi:hypothetical protein